MSADTYALPSVKADDFHEISLQLKSLVFLVFIYVGRIHEAIPFIAGLPVAKVAFGGSLILALTSARQHSLGSLFLGSTLLKKVTIIFIIAVLSIPGSIWFGASVNFAFSHFLKLLIFVYLIATFVKSEADARYLIWWFSVTILLVALFGAMGGKMVAGRIAVGATYDPNDLALILVMSLPLMYYLMEIESGWRRSTLLGMIVTVLFAIPLTGSRGGILALVAVLAAVILKRGLRRSIWLVIALLLLAVVVVAYTPAEHLERFRTIGEVHEDYNMSAQGGRIEIWKRSLPLIMAHPLLGSGGGSFMVAEGTTHEFGKWSAAHNSFIQIAVELGIIALIFHVLLIRQMFIVARKASIPWLGKGVEVAMYGYCVGGFFLSWGFAYLLYFVIGLAFVLERSLSSTSPEFTTLNRQPS